MPNTLEIDWSAVEAKAYSHDPVSWVTRKLNETIWSKQREILYSVRDHRRTAVQACHNSSKSHTAARVLGWWQDTHPPGAAESLTSAPSHNQVKNILWKEFRRVHAKGCLTGRVNQTEFYGPGLVGEEQLLAFGRKPRDENEEGFSGTHSQYPLVIFDEASGMPNILWDSAESIMSNKNARFLAIGQPHDPNTRFGEICKVDSGWNVIKIGYEDTPNFTGEQLPPEILDQLISPLWVNEKKVSWGESSPTYVARVLGEFPESTQDGLISTKLVQQAVLRESDDSYGRVQLGVDVGAGGNMNVFALSKGNSVKIIKRDQVADTMRTVGNVFAAVREHNIDIVNIDENGVGRGAADRIKEVLRDSKDFMFKV